MPLPPPAHLATVRRGDAVEVVVRGHIAVVGADGTVVAAAGDPEATTTVRSCVKPLQALPFVRRALDQLGASPEELAIACASHSGEPAHLEVVSRLLSRVGLDESALSCGPQLPFDDESAGRILAAGGKAGRLTNNCSGKHAAMLATCVVAGLPVAGYASWDHPLQREVRHGMSEFAGVDVDTLPRGVDGCGLATHGAPLDLLARVFAVAAGSPEFSRCQAAMAAHPHLVAGRGRFDTDLLATAGEHLTCKGGGAAVWVAVRRPTGPALAIKLEGGDMTAMPAVALSALRTLGWIDDAELATTALAGHVRPSVTNWDGEIVGSVAVEPGWELVGPA